jgi:hypothetical protein
MHKEYRHCLEHVDDLEAAARELKGFRRRDLKPWHYATIDKVSKKVSAAILPASGNDGMRAAGPATP